MHVLMVDDETEFLDIMKKRLGRRSMEVDVASNGLEGVKAVKAMCDGTVVLTGFHYFSGGAVYVDHGGGVFSVYFHLSKILVKKGQKVSAGDVLALSGATGRVTGPHLHLGINAGSAWLDALPLLGEAKIAPGVEKVYELK